MAVISIAFSNFSLIAGTVALASVLQEWQIKERKNQNKPDEQTQMEDASKCQRALQTEKGNTECIGAD